jgi:SAM-dependent methyltransferase
LSHLLGISHSMSSGFDAHSSELTAQEYSSSPFYQPDGPHAEWLASELCAHVSLRPESRLLDVGCGTGTFAGILMRQAGMAAVVGIEPDAARAAEAVERGGGHGHGEGVRLLTVGAVGARPGSHCGAGGRGHGGGIGRGGALRCHRPQGPSQHSTLAITA